MQGAQDGEDGETSGTSLSLDNLILGATIAGQIQLQRLRDFAKSLAFVDALETEGVVDLDNGGRALLETIKGANAIGIHVCGSLADLGSEEFAERQIAFGMGALSNSSLFILPQMKADAIFLIAELNTGEPVSNDVRVFIRQSQENSQDPLDQIYFVLVHTSHDLNDESACAGEYAAPIVEAMVVEGATLGAAPSLELSTGKTALRLARISSREMVDDVVVYTIRFGDDFVRDAPKRELASEIIGEAIDPARFARMRDAFVRNGGVIDQSADAQAYLHLRQAEGLTFDSKTILLPERPTTSSVFEEFIHATQHRTGRFNQAVDQFGNARAIDMMEIEAAERLIRNRRAWRIPNAETRQTIDRLRGLRERLGQ